jgi:hypothetical protein
MIANHNHDHNINNHNSNQHSDHHHNHHSSHNDMSSTKSRPHQNHKVCGPPCWAFGASTPLFSETLTMTRPVLHQGWLRMAEVLSERKPRACFRPETERSCRI